MRQHAGAAWPTSRECLAQTLLICGSCNCRRGWGESSSSVPVKEEGRWIWLPACNLSAIPSVPSGRTPSGKWWVACSLQPWGVPCEESSRNGKLLHFSGECLNSRVSPLKCSLFQQHKPKNTTQQLGSIKRI